MELHYRDLEDALIAGLGLPDARRGPLRSKIQHLQLVGLIGRRSEGRGKHAVYSKLDAEKMLACFLLIEMQWPAKSAAAFVEGNWDAFASCLEVETDEADDAGPIVSLRRSIVDDRTVMIAECISRERAATEMLAGHDTKFAARLQLDFRQTLRDAGIELRRSTET